MVFVEHPANQPTHVKKSTDHPSPVWARRLSKDPDFDAIFRGAVFVIYAQPRSSHPLKE
jgi:hypothetical protein